jgi:hypothetical protein
MMDMMLTTGKRRMGCSRPALVTPRDAAAVRQFRIPPAHRLFQQPAGRREHRDLGVASCAANCAGVTLPSMNPAQSTLGASPRASCNRRSHRRSSKGGSASCRCSIGNSSWLFPSLHLQVRLNVVRHPPQQRWQRGEVVRVRGLNRESRSVIPADDD